MLPPTNQQLGFVMTALIVMHCSDFYGWDYTNFESAHMLETNFADSYATLAGTVILCAERGKQLM